MKIFFLCFWVSLIPYISFGQSHTYTTTCRYFKCPPGQNCATQDGAAPCPACKNDRNNETIAIAKEAKRKADEKLALEKAEIARVEAELKKKREEQKERDDTTVVIDATYVNQKSTNSKTEQKDLLTSGYALFQDGNTYSIKKGQETIFSTSAYDYAYSLNGENKYFCFKKREKTEKYPSKNLINIYDTQGKIVSIEGYSVFGTVRYNDIDHCIYVTIPSGEYTPEYRPYGYIQSVRINTEEFYSKHGYYTEEFVEYWRKLDKMDGEKWSGWGYEFEKSIVLKLTINLKLLEQLTGYIAVSGGLPSY